MMKGRYEIKDTKFPELRGMRFTALITAQRELSRSVPQGRFRIWDRETKQYVFASF